MCSEGGGGPPDGGPGSRGAGSLHSCSPQEPVAAEDRARGPPCSGSMAPRGRTHGSHRCPAGLPVREQPASPLARAPTGPLPRLSGPHSLSRVTVRWSGMCTSVGPETSRSQDAGHCHRAHSPTPTSGCWREEVSLTTWHWAGAGFTLPLGAGGQLKIMEGLWVFLLSFLFLCHFYGMYV